MGRYRSADNKFESTARADCRARSFKRNCRPIAPRAITSKAAENGRYIWEKILLLIELRILEVELHLQVCRKNEGILPSGGTGHKLIQRIELFEQVIFLWA